MLRAYLDFFIEISLLRVFLKIKVENNGSNVIANKVNQID